MDTPQTAPQQQYPEQHPSPISLLEKYWGHPAFLPHQKAIITSVLKGHDTLAIMATGSGNPSVTSSPALYFGGLTLVISPLLALMKDQVDVLNARGISAAAWTGQSSIQTGAAASGQEIREGRLRFLCLARKMHAARFPRILGLVPGLSYCHR